MLKVTFNIIFWGSLLFLAIFLWTITIGQTINYEFNNSINSGIFYNILFGGTPIVILLTLFGTLKKRHDTTRKIFTIIATLGITVLAFMFLLNNLFTIGFGAWTTFNIAYEHRSNPERQIREQRYDAGALGYGGNRIVEVKPFLRFFWKVTPVDTTKINREIWARVDREGNVKFP